ncbi:MAG: DUF3106 domain-containing protein [Bacteriovorax sp.]|nr:DUF3106 domain-containing protein [Rhizobacter sp.]
MKKALIAALVALSTGLFALAPVHAATEEHREAMKEKWQNMTPAEKSAAKEKMRARYDAMPPEQQAAAKKRFAERHPMAAEKAQAKAATPVPAVAPVK